MELMAWFWHLGEHLDDGKLDQGYIFPYENNSSLPAKRQYPATYDVNDGIYFYGGGGAETLDNPPTYSLVLWDLWKIEIRM